jgi:acetoin utilization deacetylase AcuC-like enzyme
VLPIGPLVTSMTTANSHAEIKDLPTGLVYHADYLLHDPGPGHPECPARLRAIIDHLKRVDLWDALRLIQPEPAPEAAILRVHPQVYLRHLEAAAAEAPTYLDADTPISPDSYRVARLAAGGVLAAADAVMAGRVRNAFVAVRPPGHHALSDRAMGFCLLNNVAIAARHLQVAHGLERVLIADWDVHHGNGTQAIFYEDASVLYFSTHQFPFYPGTGAQGDRGRGNGVGTTVNVPLWAGSGDAEILAAFREHLVPAAEAFRPDFVLISAGFDAHVADPLASLRVTEAGYAELTAVVTSLADRFAAGRVVSVLEGGYHLEALPQAVEAHIRALSVEQGGDG